MVQDMQYIDLLITVLNLVRMMNHAFEFHAFI